MAQLTISEAAREVGLRASAIRYYEQIGILPAAQRSGGQRRYDEAILIRLAIVQRARQMGFTLDEIRELFFGFRKTTPASARWKILTQRKISELDALVKQIKEMQALLQRLQDCCTCDSLEHCGKGMLRTVREGLAQKSLPKHERLGR